MHRLYYGCGRLSPLSAGSVIQLCVAESRHARSVLRLRSGDTVQLFDGAGASAHAKIAQSTGHSVAVDSSNSGMMVTLSETPLVDTPPNPRFSLVVGLPKQSARADWLIEKTTELGVDELIMLSRSDHMDVEKDVSSEKRAERLHALAIAACKQSKRNMLPRFHHVANMDELLQQSVQTKKKIISWLVTDAAGTQSLLDEMLMMHSRSPLDNDADREVRIVVGPEGGLSSREIRLLQQSVDAKLVQMGSLRLRTETAAMAAASVMSMLRR
jgi:16S rRNA (uracil1498-N3)-methyltransferase